ncbi:hypothetical protein, partial [Ralstonia pseudosolanacearum]|uniref:hypothetical protein n=1 Tax=Ralstonia pseudosolanacearum TaxID=1310165 RepID=UPI003CEA9535
MPPLALAHGGFQLTEIGRREGTARVRGGRRQVAQGAAGAAMVSGRGNGRALRLPVAGGAAAAEIATA